MPTDDRHWIDDVEIEDATIKWNFSHFDGRRDTFNDEGERNFTVILDKQMADALKKEGWNVRELDPMEEGDPPEYVLEIKISYRFEPPKVYFIKGDRKMRVDDEKDLNDIKRSVTEQVDVIFTPSRWVNGNRSGVTAYVKELYVEIRESRFAKKYADYEEIR